MRCSAEKGDPGYDNFIVAMEHGRKVTVTLDGVEQDMVITADEEQGFVRRLVKDAEGHVYHDATRNCATDEVVRGSVKIVIEPPFGRTER